MKEITFGEFMSLLKDHYPALHCEVYRNYYDWYDREDSPAKYYLTDGCAVLYDLTESFRDPEKLLIWCRIHEVSGDCDFAEACRTFKEISDADIGKYPKHSRDIQLFHHGALSDKLNEFYGFRKFTRMGEAFGPDPHIRELTRDDLDEIRAMCDPAVLENDTWFGKCEAETFFDWDFDFYEKRGFRLLGYHENGNLLGIASWSAEDELNLGFLADLFVSPDGRGHGIGKSLVRTAISRLPDRVWVYQAARDNAPSVGLAKSLGFTFEGAALFVYSD